MRIGIGYDVHAFDPDRPLILGGIHIPGPGLAGHSDADVVVHAIVDALLGACNLGDLGDHFPDSDDWSGASSLLFIRDVLAKMTGAGWAPHNVDVTIVAEIPKIAPHRSHMRQYLSTSLGLAEDAVSIKATTTDGLGFTGRGEGIACLAVVSVKPLG